MDLVYSLKWMFVGSVIIGMFLNGMNVLAYRLDDLYLSNTLIYSAFLMASNMCILEIFMHHNYSGHFDTNLFIFFLIFSIFLVVSLREQYCVDDKQWLRRMISHHSTALTTSHKINERTKNKEIKRLSSDIILTQEKEIKLMKKLLNDS